VDGPGEKDGARETASSSLVESSRVESIRLSNNFIIYRVVSLWTFVVRSYFVAWWNMFDFDFCNDYGSV
jgi:hypothetical protein